MTESIVAIVGSGLIGRAWSIAFARAGWRVRLWDPDPVASETALGTIESLLADLAAQEMLNGAAATDVLIEEGYTLIERMIREPVLVF